MGIGEPDIAPEAFLESVEMRDRAKAWVPYRSVVTLYLWQYYVNVNSSVGDIVA